MAGRITNRPEMYEIAGYIRKKDIITVFVENEDDLPFWLSIFEGNGFASNEIKMHPASRDSLKRGKQAVLEHKNEVGKYCLLCVDSDYDYLLQNDTDDSRFINNSDFIFQTYSYSTENLRCFSESLNGILVKATMSQHVEDLQGLLAKYSEIIYDLFVYSFYLDRRSKISDFENEFTISSFCEVISLPRSKDTDFQDIFNTLNHNIVQKLKDFEINEEVLVIKNKLSDLGVTPQNTYLFIQGHCLLDNVVSVLLDSIKSDSFSKKKVDISNFAKNKNEENNKINELRNQNKYRDIKTLLLNNDNFKNCFLYKKIETDIQSYITKYKSLN